MQHLPPGSEIPEPDTVCRDQNRSVFAPGFEHAMSGDEPKSVPFLGIILGPFQTSYRRPELTTFVALSFPGRITIPIRL